MDCERETLTKRYGELRGELVVVEVARGTSKLGLSLAGNRDRTKMSVFVCGMHPAGLARRDGRIRVGDELLEVNDVVVYGRCHLNASALIKGLSGTSFRIVLLRREGAIEEMAVKPLSQFPSQLDEEAAEDKYCHYKGMHTVTVRKGVRGLGIMIIEGKHAEVGRGIFISDIQEGGAAEQAGLSVGDMILAANDMDMVGADFDTAASILKQAEGLLTLIVANPNKPSPGYRYEEDGTADTILQQVYERNQTARSCEKSRSIPAVKPSVQKPDTDPRTCDIRAGRETLLEIAKEGVGLGLSIVGGADTPLGAVIIHEVYPDGAAAVDGRLKPGDQILEVSGADLRGASHERAIAALRQTPSAVQMAVWREAAARQEALEVELQRRPGRGLGLSIAGRRDAPGVYVSEVVRGGAAEADGRLVQGDQILEVNSHDLRSASQEHAAAVLKTTMGRIHMKIGRLKAGSRKGASCLTTTPKIQENIDSYRTVVVERGNAGLGFSVAGGGDLPLYVRGVCEGGPAAGLLRPGDRLLSLGGQSLEALSHEQAVEELRKASGAVTFRIRSVDGVDRGGSHPGMEEESSRRQSTAES